VEALKKNWLKFSESKISVVGLVIVAIFLILAIFGKFLVPYPKHIGSYVDFANAGLAPSSQHLCGTDLMGRDIFSRIIGSFRNTLLMGVIVLCVSVPVGFMVGVIAGYSKGKRIDTVLMRITDIFLAIPPLVLALAIGSTTSIKELVKNNAGITFLYKFAVQNELQEKSLVKINISNFSIYRDIYFVWLKESFFDNEAFVLFDYCRKFFSHYQSIVQAEQL